MSADDPATPKLGGAVLIVIGDRRVGLTRVPIRRESYAFTVKHHEGGGHPHESALIEIRIDGEFVGLASRPHGFGKQSWRIFRLLPTRLRHDEGVYLGEGLLNDCRYTPRSEQVWTMRDLALKAVALRFPSKNAGSSRLMTVAEIDAWMEREAKRVAADKVKQAARSAQWAREAAQAKARREEHRAEVLAGLRDVAERADLSNLERAAIVAAVARYEGDRG